MITPPTADELAWVAIAAAFALLAWVCHRAIRPPNRLHGHHTWLAHSNRKPPQPPKR
jgi:hypothetical protein